MTFGIPTAEFSLLTSIAVLVLAILAARLGYIRGR